MISVFPTSYHTLSYTHVTPMQPAITHITMHIRAIGKLNPKLVYAIWFSNLVTLQDAAAGRVEVARLKKLAKQSSTGKGKGSK